MTIALFFLAHLSSTCVLLKRPFSASNDAREGVLLLAATAANAAAANAFCSVGQVGSCVQSLSKFTTEVSSFCSSLLHVKTDTVFVPKTVKQTITNTVKTVTLTTVLPKQEQTTTSYRYTLYYTVYTATVTETSTYLVPYFTATPTAKRLERDVASASPNAHITTDQSGGALGFTASIVTNACSCLVTTPKVTTTQETAITKTVKATSTITQYSSTLTLPPYKETDASEVDITVPAVSTTTVLAVTTKTHMGTHCGGASPTVKFQVYDTDRARTDEYDGNYAMVPYVVDDFDIGHFYATADESAASLFVLEADGKLKTGPELIANLDYFGGFELPFFSRKAAYKLRHFLPLFCTLITADPTLLGCTVNNCFGPGNITILQTCPIYGQYYGTPFIFGDILPIDAPVCYEFLFRVIPVCTPK